MTVNITNSAPRFKEPLKPYILAKYNETTLHPLPNIVDDERNDFSVKHTQLLSFVTFKDNIYTIYPNDTSQAGRSFFIYG